MKELTIAQLQFNPEKGTLLAHVFLNKEELSDTASFVEQNGFHYKDEFHLTIIGYKEGSLIVAHPELIAKITELIARSIEQPITCTLTDDILLIEKEYGEEHRFSLIALCHSVALTNLRAEINAIINPILGGNKESFWHITLATRTATGERHDGIGIASKEDLITLKPKAIQHNEIISTISKIIVPTRMQPDTIASIFLLQQFGGEVGLSLAPDYVIVINPQPHESFWDSMRHGTLQLDCVGGLLDHHSWSERTTLTSLVAIFLQQSNNPSIEKIQAYVERDDFHGKGTISTDMLDKAFGLSGLITSLNKIYADNPKYITDTIIPLFKAHHEEERKRNEYFPQLVKEMKENNTLFELKTRQRKKKIDVVFVESDEPSLPGYLRSSIGGRYDIVVQRRSTGHTNIITRPLKNIDLRALVALVRKSELLLNKKDTHLEEKYLAREGKIVEVPEWYYDKATNTLQNGGLIEGEILPTAIPFAAFKNLIDAGISESLWSPMAR